MLNSKYQSHMAACCTYHRPTNFLLAAKQGPYKIVSLLTKNIEEFSGKYSQDIGPLAEKGTRQKELQE